jgi:hypothetical protein
MHLKELKLLFVFDDLNRVDQNLYREGAEQNEELVIKNLKWLSYLQLCILF